MEEEKVPLFTESENVLQTPRSMIVGTSNNYTHVHPDRGIGLNQPPDLDAVMGARGQYYSLLYANGTASATPTIDWAKANVQSIGVSQNVTFSFIHGKSGGRYLLLVRQDESGSRTYTWPSSFAWPSNETPSASAGGKLDVIGMVYDGSTFYAISSLNYI